ncbi:MAG: hypothetical protein KGL16_05885, partial [Acidobacteriota bacterium]|nr:hypothetical protein [Acidobacteriota bacterium]
MTYLGALENELKAAGLPARRRRRIVIEFSDHLHENPSAQLGEPNALARQFADELGTRLARRAAMVTFAGLAIAGCVVAAVMLLGTRVVLLPVGTHQSGYIARASGPTFPVFVVFAQVALAAGMLALLRAWRLRRAPVITAADAAILYRRAGIGLLAGILTVGSAPISTVIAHGGWVAVRAVDVASPCVLLLLLIALFILPLSRLRPAVQGPAADLTFDLGIRDSRVTPLRVALVLSALILV